MATLGFIPNPSTVSVKTSSYTIPANTYARASVSVIGSGTFTINGATALGSTQHTILSGSGLCYSTLAGQLNTNNTANNATSAFTTATVQHNLNADYWLPAGTVINGTGTFRIALEEFSY